MKTTNSTIGQTLRVALLATTASLGAMAWTAPALAQDDEEADEAPAQAIVITGSRIARPEYEANSPMVTVDDRILQQSSSAALEQSLNKLPQFIPAQTPTMGGDIQPTATNTPGAATISLRGVGANRNLVLVDGRRATPSNASGVVDISTIPSAAIARVEVISGGASATYGADAVAGVTNFILKKDFVGLELDGQMGLTQRGDGREWQISGIMGTDFADGRGNVSIAMSINSRSASYQRDRSWYRDLWANPNTGGTQFFIDRPGINLGFGNNPSSDFISSYFAGANPALTGGPTGNVTGATVYTTEDGGLFTTARGQRGGVPFFGPVDNYKYKVSANGVFSQNNTDLYLILPLDRYNMFFRGNYEINDWVGVFAQGLYSHVTTYTKNEPGPIFAGWGASIPWGTGVYTGSGRVDNSGNPSSVLLNGMSYFGPGAVMVNGASVYGDPTPGNLADNPTNPAFAAKYGLQFSCANLTSNPTGGCTNTTLFQGVIPADLQALLNSRANPNAPWTFTALMPDPRETFTDVSTYNMIAGLEGSIPGTDWTWEAFANHGQSETFARQTGIYSLERTRLLLGAPNMGEGFAQQGNTVQGGFGASTGVCTTGLVFFQGTENISEDCLEAIRADLKNRTAVRQTIFEANLQGTLLDLPAGSVGMAIGASHRTLDFQFINDTLTTQGRSFTDQALGIYPSGNSFGRYTAKEVYGELLIPILKDIPAIQQFNLEVGGRISDYSTTGTSYTFKVLGDWEVTDWLRLRGGYNRAERSPNIGELYLAPQQTFGVNNVGDVCAARNPASFSANPATNSNAANVEAMCRILMEASGDDEADDFFYQKDPNTGAYINGANSNSTFGFAFPTTVGNPDLVPETADTWTLGAVIQSPFDTPALSRLRMTVDYFHISVNDAIGIQSIGVAQRQCFDPAYNPAAGSNPATAVQSAFCQNITRNAQNGGLGNVYVTYANNGRFSISGIDTQVDYSIDVGPGTLALNATMNYMLHLKVAELPTDPLVDYVGTQGTTVNGLNGGAFRFRLFGSMNYTVGGFGIGVNWQHLSAVEDATEAQLGISTPTTGLPTYDLFGLNMNYSFSRDINVRFTVENLFDRKPPLVGVNTANTDPAGTGNLSGGTYNSQYNDTQGRRFAIGARFKF